MMLAGCKVAEENIIRIGISAPLTGPVAQFGEWARRGAELAAEELRKEDKKIEILFQDDACTPSEGTKTAQWFISQGIHTIITACSAAVPGTMSQATNDMLILTPSPKSDVVKNYSNLFSLEPSIEAEMKFLAEFIQSNKSVKKLAILYVNNDLGVSYKDAFQETWKKREGKITEIETFELVEKDFRTQLVKIRETKPEGLLVIMSGGGLGIILKQAKELGLNTQFFGTSITESSEFIKTAGTLAEGVIYSYTFILRLTSTSKKFQEEYEKKYQELPERMATNTYDAVLIISYLYGLCNENTHCVIEELSRLKNFEGASGILRFDKEGNTVKKIYIKTVRNGKFILLN